jgi:trimeric autotransporter adhesin
LFFIKFELVNSEKQIKKNYMKKHFTKYLGVVALLTSGSLLLEAQTITAPLGTPITITNSIDVTGDVNIGTTNSLKLGGGKFLSGTASDVFMGLNTGTAATGGLNTFIGTNAGASTSLGSSNFFLGYSAGSDNTSGSSNVFMGVNAGRKNTIASSNVFIGGNAGRENLTGIENLAIGTNAGSTGSAGNENVFVGIYAGGLSTSSNNTFIGRGAGYTNTTGGNNTYIGNGAGSAGTTATISNATAIGAGATVTANNSLILGNGVNVGIGTTAPTAKLEIAGSAASKSGIKNASLLGSGVTSGVRTPSQGYLTVDNTGEIVWAASGATARLGNPDGITSAEGTATFSDNNWSLSNGYLKNTSKRGVVIGEGITSMPEGYSFYVADGILTEKVKVAIKGTDEWADYVFGKNYNRMSLADVAKYIEKNNHLPNVPSAAEMVQNGNDLHKTDVKLLEKIEELTLYMIEMKKENEQLKKDVDSLKKRRK